MAGDTNAWMSELPDSTNLYDILIPGTHDTATANYKGFNWGSGIKTQDLDIK